MLDAVMVSRMLDAVRVLLDAVRVSRMLDAVRVSRMCVCWDAAMVSSPK